MDKAKSLILGGKRIFVDEYLDYLNYSLYNDLKLRCIFFCESVHFRNGDIIIPHFAHFPNLPQRKLEACQLRQQQYNSSSLSSWLTSEVKGQRLEIFQEHFLNIIATNDSKFHRKLENIKYICSNLEQTTIKDIEWFNKRKRILFTWIDIFFSNKQNQELVILVEQIVQEAIDYLSLNSSRSILEKILHYLKYRFITQEDFSFLQNWR